METAIGSGRDAFYGPHLFGSQFRPQFCNVTSSLYPSHPLKQLQKAVQNGLQHQLPKLAPTIVKDEEEREENFDANSTCSYVASTSGESCTSDSPPTPPPSSQDRDIFFCHLCTWSGKFAFPFFWPNIVHPKDGATDP